MAPPAAPEKCRVLGCVDLLSQHLGFTEVPSRSCCHFLTGMGDLASSLITPRARGMPVSWVSLSARLPRARRLRGWGVGRRG